MTILLFDGEEDAYWWILCLEKFFKEHETPKSLKVLKAVGALRGSAFTWWIWWCRVHPRYNWDTFTTALLWHFKPEWREILPISYEEEEPIEESSSLIEQSVTVDVDFSKFVEDFDKSENEDFHDVADVMIPLEPPDPNLGTVVEALEESFDLYRSQQEQSNIYIKHHSVAELKTLGHEHLSSALNINNLHSSSTKFDSAESENLHISEPILYITLTPLALAADESLDSAHSTTQDAFSLDVVGEAEDIDTLLEPMTLVLGKLIQPQLSPPPEPPDSISVPVSLMPLDSTHLLFDEMPKRDAARFCTAAVLHIISMTYSPGPFNHYKFHDDVDFEIPSKPPYQMVIQTWSLFLSYFSKQSVHYYPEKAEKEHSTSLKPRFNTFNDLVNVILEVTKCVIEFNEIQVQYNSHNVTASTQAINLIGNQGSLIKTIQESTGASVRVLAREDLPSDVGADERIVERQGQTLKVLKGLEAVVENLRKLLVDHSVIPLFKKTFNASIYQDCQTDFWAEKPSLHSASQCNIVTNIPPKTKRAYFFSDRERQLDSLLSSSTMSHSSISGLRSEVGRVVGMVEGVVLVVDAREGPLAQTKFVLAKALKYGLRPILLLNKVDWPAVTEEICDEVESLVFDFPILYASAKEGWASTTYTKDPPAEAKNMSQLLDAIVTHVPPPNANFDAPFQMVVSMMEKDLYLGRILTGCVYSGVVRVGDRVHGLRNKDSGAEEFEEGKVVKLMKKNGTTMVVTDCAGAGDIISIAGLESPPIGHTLTTVEIMFALPTVELDPPTISMTFGVNDSPLAGRDGIHLTGGKIGDRLTAEAETNLAINVLPGMLETFEVQGRGELQLGILIENMRREGFELSVSPPKVMYKTEKGQKLEPIEELSLKDYLFVLNPVCISLATHEMRKVAKMLMFVLNLRRDKEALWSLIGVVVNVSHFYPLNYASVDSARQNLAATFVNAWFGQDMDVASDASSSGSSGKSSSGSSGKWLFKNKGNWEDLAKHVQLLDRVVSWLSIISCLVSLM